LKYIGSTGRVKRHIYKIFELQDLQIFLQQLLSTSLSNNQIWKFNPVSTALSQLEVVDLFDEY